MAATYDTALPTDKDWVRFLSGDRNVAKPFLQDEEIAALLQEEPNKYYAAARACEAYIAKTGGIVTKKVAELQLHWTDNSSAKSVFTEYIRSLKERGAEELLPRPKTFRTLS
jgi:hypothetical protein